MNKKKKYIIIGSVTLLILITSFLSLNFNKNKELPVIIQSEQNQIKDVLKEKLKTEIPIQKNEDKKNLEITEDINNIKVSLIVLDKRYETNIKENSSVFEVMKKIEEENINNNLFNFEYTEYASLGSFITEINGIKGTSGKYWIYYVNNIEASVGVSKYILKDGDSVLWKQE